MTGFFVTIVLIGLLAAHQLVLAYYGPGIQPPRWFRWLNYGVLLALAMFLVVMAWQIISMLSSE